jgi:hypothetical protein
MKRLLLLSLLFITLGLQAQNLPPQTINFQGVAIDKNGVPVPGMDEVGNPIQNASIRIRFTVLMGSATGTPSYQEEHLANTDEFGRFNLEIGRGTALIGPFTNIRWGEDRHFLKVETDLTGVGSAYTLSSVQEFLSVPYALYAKTAGNSNDDLDKDPQNEIQTLTLSGNLLSINQGNTVTLPADSDQQQLSISGAVITISNGNSISLPPDADNQVLAVSGNNLTIANGNTVALPVSPDNQALSISGNTLSISNGNSVALPPNTDNQTLAISGNAISISNGNSIILPTAPDNQTLALSGSTLTISNGNSVALPADSDNQTLSVVSSGNNRTVSIAGGNSVNFRVNDADSSSTNELQTISLSGNTLSITNGNSVVLPSTPKQVDLNQCFSNGSLYLIPSNLPTFNEISAIAFHDSIVLFQLMNTSDTLYYRYNYKNNSLNVVNITGNILNITPIDSLVFLQSKSKLFTYNLENNVVNNISIQCLNIYKSTIDIKTKEYYVVVNVDGYGDAEMYRYNPSNNNVALRSINPYDLPRFELFNTDTLVMHYETNFVPVLRYFKFSTNVWLSTIYPPNIWNFIVDPIERNFLNSQFKEPWDGTCDLIIHSKNNQLQLSLGRGFILRPANTDIITNSLHFNRNGLFFFNFNSGSATVHSGEVVINNLYTDQKKQLIEINKSTGEAEVITGFLFNPDKLKVNLDNILITPARRICFKDTYVSQACFMVIE